MVKNLQCGRHRFNPWVGKIPWRREKLPTPVFLPGESHGQRSLAGYSPWGLKESDTTEPLTLSYISNPAWFLHKKRNLATITEGKPGKKTGRRRSCTNQAKRP